MNALMSRLDDHFETMFAAQETADEIEVTDEHRAQAETEVCDMDYLAERLTDSAYLPEFASELFVKSEKFRAEVMAHAKPWIDERALKLATAQREEEMENCNGR